MPIDWEATERKAIKHLMQILRPVHYRELCRWALEGLPDNYSDKTDHEEKFRQRYAEHERPEIFIVPGKTGWMALRRWFPVAHQPMLIPPEELVIDGSCLISYGAGYEHAKREPHLKDWYQDGQSEARYNRRMLAFQFEFHVRDYYLANWTEFCKPPSNHKRYEQPADNDFLVRLPDGEFYKIDTKTPSYEECGHGQYKVRRLNRSTIYIGGHWDPMLERAVVKGVISGRWLNSVAGYTHGDFFTDGDLMSFEVLSVMLNMAKCGMRPSYRDLMQALIKIPTTV